MNYINPFWREYEYSRPKKYTVISSDDVSKLRKDVLFHWNLGEIYGE